MYQDKTTLLVWPVCCHCSVLLSSCFFQDRLSRQSFTIVLQVNRALEKQIQKYRQQALIYTSLLPLSLWRKGPDISRDRVAFSRGLEIPFYWRLQLFPIWAVTGCICDEGRLRVAAQLLRSSWEHGQTKDVQTTKTTVLGFAFTVAVYKPTQPCPLTKGSIEQESRVLMPAVPRRQIKIMTYFWCLYTVQHNSESSQTCWRVPLRFRRISRQIHLDLHRGTPAAPGACCLPGRATPR